jgi:hypothetical protein
MLQDLRFAIRVLARDRWFTVVAVLSLALGIGANTAIFSLINTLMLRPLPVRAPHELVQFMSVYPGDPRMNGFAYMHYERMRDANTVFSDVIGGAPARLSLSREGSAPLPVSAWYVTGNFFPALGVEPALGRLLRGQDDRIGNDAAVAVLSWSYWSSRFASDPAIVGRQITINNVPVTVVGVAAKRFTGIEVATRADLWLPTAVETMIEQPSQRQSGRMFLAVMARLKPGCDRRAGDRGNARARQVSRRGHVAPLQQQPSMAEGASRRRTGRRWHLHPPRECEPAAARADGDGGGASAAGLRQHRQPAAGAWCGARA